ncbi:MAG: helix-turn-helix transcriptional regulator [Synergistaceae bacterium]|nr:helix-turn-helix transcriptional regulator [Synergistaceae bacterium]MBR0076123.1 helix-turn-helix transcriptional regulator [Synergistaceae bacterium]MBR0079936.1 helix-turn-helix transcriptional regulator [Synergistaceae bacterium]MBR0233998.1 helix-turn-helix transcriptional regulator [Synergistaceae bacterium]MBR0252524.1 helix-turn-helix transcriptional regulator [Synergistaceae bacterium]
MKEKISGIFTKRMNKLLQQRYISKKEMASRLGLTYLTFWRKLNGERSVDIELLQKIAEVLGTSTAYLLGETDNPAPPIENEADENKNLPIINVEDNNLGLGYWGKVADNAVIVAQQGDKKSIALIIPLVKAAYETLAGIEMPKQITKTGINLDHSHNNDLKGARVEVR